MGTLRQLREDAYHRLSELYEEYKPSWDPETALYAWRLFTDACLMAAEVALLADSDLKDYARWVARAGGNWFTLLERARRQKFEVPASYNEALMALVAVGDLNVAADLARRSASALVPPEYDDEFRWAYFLQRLVVAAAGGPFDAGAMTSLAAELRKVAPDHRADLADAVAARDAKAFWEAFAAAAEAYREDMNEKRQNPAAPYHSWRAAQHVWLEGMALQRMAEALGLGTPPRPVKAIPRLAMRARPVADDRKYLLGT
jgi:hypothetical protein